jgi:hypothetical protein
MEYTIELFASPSEILLNKFNLNSEIRQAYMTDEIFGDDYMADLETEFGEEFANELIKWCDHAGNDFDIAKYVTVDTKNAWFEDISDLDLVSIKVNITIDTKKLKKDYLNATK